MDLTGILFKPNGRIGPASFWRGLFVLIGISVVLQIIQVFGPAMFGMIFGLLSIGLIYPYVVLFGKRLHDSGRTAWWFLAILVVWGGIGYFIGTMMQNVFAPDMKEQLEIAAESGSLSSIMEVSRQVAKQTFLPGLVTGLVMQGALGYLMASLKSDPGTNKFGPPEGGDVDVFD